MINNTVAALSGIALKPRSWVVTHDRGCYTVEFSYTDQLNDFFHIRNARGLPKVYKSVKAAISDIRRVHDSPLVKFYFQDCN